MELDKCPRPHSQVAARVMGDQALIVLSDSGEVTVLNPIGTRIWELIDGTHSLRQMIDAIVSEYEVTEAQAQQDVEEFVQELLLVNAIVMPA
ncbi:MAG: PqqD family protein [Anaerolineae bacterium]